LKKKIKIAINTRFLLKGKLEGIGTYSHQILQRLVKQTPEVEFHFLFDREWSEEYIYAKNVIPHKLSPQARHPFLWYWWFEKSVTKWLRNNPVDLFLSLDSFLSLKTKTPTFLVMHDLAFEHYPEHVPFLVRKYYQYFFPKFAKKTKHIFAVSEFTKQDIVSRYKIDKQNISVAYCGVSDIYKPLNSSEQSTVRKQISNDSPYFISIGSLNPRKNTLSVVQAFNQLKEEKKCQKYKLLIVGAKGWKTNNLYEEIDKSAYKNDIILLGHLEPKELSKYLASAEALVFPSLFEGFGIPIVEAYKCETIVITSNCSSTKEIGDGTSLLVNPKSVSEIKEAMFSVEKNSAISKEQKALIETKLKLYNWGNSALNIERNILEYLTNL